MNKHWLERIPLPSMAKALVLIIGSVIVLVANTALACTGAAP
jgi:hypothetical protein